MKPPSSWIFLASLLLNALLIGFLGAQLGRHLYWAERPLPFPPRWDDASHAVLERTFAGQRAALDTAMKQMEAAKQRVEGLLRQDNIDPSAFDDALKAMETANTAAFESLVAALRNASTKSAEERKVLADVLARLPPPGPAGPRGLLLSPPSPNFPAETRPTEGP